MNPCKDCLTFSICRNLIIQHIKEFRREEKKESKEPQVFVKYKTIVYVAYISQIYKKCRMITDIIVGMETERKSSLSIHEEAVLIETFLNISEKDCEN